MIQPLNIRGFVCLSVASSCQNLIILTTCIHRFSQNLLHIFVIPMIYKFYFKTVLYQFSFYYETPETQKNDPVLAPTRQEIKGHLLFDTNPSYCFFFLNHIPLEGSLLLSSNILKISQSKKFALNSMLSGLTEEVVNVNSLRRRNSRKHNFNINSLELFTQIK